MVRSADVATAVVYLTTHTHHTFRKALHIAGLSDCVIREIPLDAGLRMDCTALRLAVESDVSQGLRPWLIAASAGTTDAGAVDEFHAIADIAVKFHLWMHVDAAYGGAFALCDEGRQRLDGIERSDSLVLDPHKGFFSCPAVPASCSCATVPSFLTPTTHAGPICRMWPATQSARPAITRRS